jgi:hypothetical protein
LHHLQKLNALKPIQANRNFRLNYIAKIIVGLPSLEKIALRYFSQINLIHTAPFEAKEVSL